MNLKLQFNTNEVSLEYIAYGYRLWKFNTAFFNYTHFTENYSKNELEFTLGQMKDNQFIEGLFGYGTINKQGTFSIEIEAD